MALPWLPVRDLDSLAGEDGADPLPCWLDTAADHFAHAAPMHSRYQSMFRRASCKRVLSIIADLRRRDGRGTATGCGRAGAASAHGLGRGPARQMWSLREPGHVG